MLFLHNAEAMVSPLKHVMCRPSKVKGMRLESSISKPRFITPPIACVRRQWSSFQQIHPSWCCDKRQTNNRKACDTTIPIHWREVVGKEKIFGPVFVIRGNRRHRLDFTAENKFVFRFGTIHRAGYQFHFSVRRRRRLFPPPSPFPKSVITHKGLSFPPLFRWRWSQPL